MGHEWHIQNIQHFVSRRASEILHFTTLYNTWRVDQGLKVTLGFALLKNRKQIQLNRKAREDIVWLYTISFSFLQILLFWCIIKTKFQICDPISTFISIGNLWINNDIIVHEERKKSGFLAKIFTLAIFSIPLNVLLYNKVCLKMDQIEILVHFICFV